MNDRMNCTLPPRPRAIAPLVAAMNAAALHRHAEQVRLR
jgi:hypothetical protein